MHNSSLSQDTPPELFDTSSIKKFHERALKNDFEAHSFLFTLAEKEIIARLDVIKRDFSKPCIIGHRHTDCIKPKLSTAPIITNRQNLNLSPQSYDLILSTLELHTANDLVGSLIQIRQGLKEDGLFMGTLFGGDTLTELRQAMMLAESDCYGGVSPRISPMIDIKDMSALMQRAGYALPVIDYERVKVSYKELSRLFKDLRGMGESNAVVERRKSFSSRRFFDKVEDYYRQMFTNSDGQFEATFDIIFVLGWSPSSTQQQPCTRGSATHDLADFLSGEHND